jgi:hypothetical protein
MGKPTKEENAGTENAETQMEQRDRSRAESKGFSVESAIYVVEALFPTDEDSVKLSRPFVSIFPDKVVQNRKSIFNSSSEEIPLAKITSVELTGGFVPKVNVYASGNTLSFNTDGVRGKKFVQVLRAELSKQGIKSSPGTISSVEQLEKLASLFEKGHLTKAEFDLKKKQILDS